MTTFIYSKKSSLSLKGRTLNLFENEMIKETLKKYKIKNKCILILDEKIRYCSPFFNFKSSDIFNSISFFVNSSINNDKGEKMFIFGKLYVSLFP